ncbi:tetratricopeptide repeat protein 4 isoform X1 [Polyodon spathula]|uniref:tetratricopeptide repeat protein 4 isoform X1 n=2 Tax=Polyodon spathula TaxID=7913 RepID=UPI001B7DF604|nr:tetratricopeptide repeat protein 4 isoform X1 [Polyodon spathula]
MASQTQNEPDDDCMDEFMDKFTTQKYKGGFNEKTWEEEFEKVPMFMKKAPEVIDPVKNPELACLQSIIFSDDTPLEEQATTYKNEGNDYFKEKKYKQAIASYSEGLKKKCGDTELNAVLHTNRAAAQFHLGNFRSALNDALAAKKLKPDHQKAIIRGALCLVELKKYSEAISWCDEGLRADPKEKKLLELRLQADQLRRAWERDARKSKLKEKKKQCEEAALLKAIKDRKIKLFAPAKAQRRSSDDEEDEEGVSGALAELSLDGISSENATGARVFLDESGSLNWPVLFLYPECGQTDFISAFHEGTRFLDHLTVMFGEELPPWDTERKYRPQDLQLYFADEEREEVYQVNPEHTLLEVLKHDRYFIKAGTANFIVLVKGSSFCKEFLSDKKVHRLKRTT